MYFEWANFLSKCENVPIKMFLFLAFFFWTFGLTSHVNHFTKCFGIILPKKKPMLQEMVS